jgi:hypothetical protein
MPPIKGNQVHRGRVRTVVQAELQQTEAPQFKDLHAAVLHIIWGHVDGEGGQLRGPPVAQQAVEPANK